MELLNEWMDIAMREQDVETQKRLRVLMTIETERARIHQAWQEGDRSAVLGLVYPDKQLGNGNHDQ